MNVMSRSAAGKGKQRVRSGERRRCGSDRSYAAPIANIRRRVNATFGRVCRHVAVFCVFCALLGVDAPRAQTVVALELLLAVDTSTSVDREEFALQQRGLAEAFRHPDVISAIERAGKTLRGLDWFEVREIRGNINDGKVAWYQVKVGIGFRVLEPADLEQE